MSRIGSRSVARLASTTLAFLTSAVLAGAMVPTAVGAPAADSTLHDIVPAPVSVKATPGKPFALSEHSRIHADGEATKAADYLAELLRPSTGYALPVTREEPAAGDVVLRMDGADAKLGPSGYRLKVDNAAVTIHATSLDGLFNGVQSVRQALPAKVESRSVQPGPWEVPAGEVLDRPRFQHRSTMLDVSRHFFGVDEIKRHIDRIALYKVNHLHLHLSDDQGWRLQINSWPRLAEHGGSTQVGGGPGGYYTQQDYTDIVNYAASRNVTIVPEIDMPGHTNAALASYAELNCDGVAPPLYTGTDVGFSSLCVNKDITYRFLDDVIREVAALTPGPYLHIGGDEAHATSEEDYQKFVSLVLPIVEKYGKTPIGWHEYTKAEPKPGAVAQYWGTETSDQLVTDAAKRGNTVLMSPANKAYLDMKYNKDTPVGLDWAGYIEVRDAYEWDPGTHLRGVPESAVDGVEAPLWTETVETPEHIELLTFPRLPAIAELGWSQADHHDWESFRTRLATHGPRWTVLGIDYYRSPQVPWVD